MLVESNAGARRTKATARDSAAVIQAAYDLSGAEDAWLAALVRALEPVLGRGLGVFGAFYSRGENGTDLRLHTPVFVNCPDAMLEALSQALSAVGHDDCSRPATHAMLSKTGTADLMLARVDALQPHQIAFGAPVTTITRFPPRTASLMERLGRHIAAGYRLRRAFAPKPKERAWSLLTEAAQQHGDPQAALTLWLQLVEGRFSLIEATDHDAKRYLLARRNVPDELDPGALTSDERVVLARFALGHCGKVVAYDVGVSPSTITSRLQAGLHKLGLRSVAELARVSSTKELPSLPHQLVPCDLVATRFSVEGDDYVLFSFPMPELAPPTCLTTAECEVVRGLFAGQSNAEIAHGRGCAVRTVANQLRSIFRKLGVSSRGEVVQHCKAAAQRS